MSQSGPTVYLSCPICFKTSHLVDECRLTEAVVSIGDFHAQLQKSHKVTRHSGESTSLVITGEVSLVLQSGIEAILGPRRRSQRRIHNLMTLYRVQGKPWSCVLHQDISWNSEPIWKGQAVFPFAHCSSKGIKSWMKLLLPLLALTVTLHKCYKARKKGWSSSHLSFGSWDASKRRRAKTRVHLEAESDNGGSWWLMQQWRDVGTAVP